MVRAMLAIVLMVGFYLLAIGIVIALLYASFLILKSARFGLYKLLPIPLVGVWAIVKGIQPRRDEFVPPGPELDPARHPRLFNELHRIATAVGQPMPSEVYLVADVNAFVTRRGGVMGIGSRPVMGIGLPLLQALTVSELRGVLAHEFGHYHGGETRLGPFIYTTRAAIGRTLEHMEDDSLLRVPFNLYAKLFMRVTMAVSRHQELAADALAARLTGRRPLMEGLRKLREAAILFNAYLGQELGPALDAGFRPPMAEGFDRYMKSAVANELRPRIASALEMEAQDPYDSHPALADRLRALAAMAVNERPEDSSSALSLIEDPAVHECELLQGEPGGRPITSLKVIGWHEVLPRVYLPRWRKVADRIAPLLSGKTLGDLPALGARPGELLRDIRRVEGGGELAPEDEIGRASFLVGCCLFVTLEKSGWMPETDVGAPVVLRKGTHEIKPLEAFGKLLAKTPDVAGWQDFCRLAGVAELRLDNPVVLGQ